MPPIGPSPTNTLDVLLHQNPTIAANSGAMVATVTIPPGDPGTGPHRHSGPVFGYVLEGEILFELEGEEPYPVKAGQAFWEPASTSCIIRRPTCAPTSPASSWSSCSVRRTCR